jgi:Tol biopolymer transport system component
MRFAAARWINRSVRGFSFAAVAALLCWPLVGQAGEVRFQGEGHAENPSWSLDGRFLAFEVNRFAGDIDMYFAELAGDIAKEAMKVKLPGSGSGFGSSDQVVMNATWHKDGIAVFEGSSAGGQLRLYFASPGGASAAEMLPNTKVPGELTFPTISPDGNKLAFISDATGNGDVRTWDRSTDQLDQVTSTPGSESFPYYGPDGNRLLFTRKQNESLSIYEYGLSGGSETALASGMGDQTRPVYAADGHIVFFSGEDEAKWNLMVIDSAGQNKQTLAEGVRFPTRARPALTPDGQWAAYGYDDPTKNERIVLTRIDGSRSVEIVTEFVACGEPSISIQNGRTLLAYTALPSEDSDWRFLYVLDITDRL